MISRHETLVNVTEQDEPDIILRTFILFSQTAREVPRYTDARLYREAGLSEVKLIVLMAINHNNGVMTPSAIAEWTQTERHNVTTLVRRMKEGGFVTTERNVWNRRSINVAITDKGREVLAQVMPVARKIVDQVMSSITKEDAGLLEKLLKIIRQNAHSGLKEVTGST